MGFRPGKSAPTAGAALALLSLGLLAGSAAWARCGGETCGGLASSIPMSPSVAQSDSVPHFDPAAVSRAMAAIGLSCTQHNSSTGMNCTGKPAGYPEPIAIFVPAGFRPDQTHDVIVHIHGNQSGSSSIAPAQPGDFNQFLSRWNFAQLLADSHRNSILVVPFSHGATGATNHAELVPRFNSLMDQINGALRSAQLQAAGTVPNIALTGHSGAIYPITGILKAGCPPSGTCYTSHIHEMDLFDATYTSPPELARFAADPQNRFTATWLPGTDTEQGARALKEAVDAAYSQRRLAAAREATAGETPAAIQPASPPHVSFEPVHVVGARAHVELVHKYFSSKLDNNATARLESADEKACGVGI